LRASDSIGFSLVALSAGLIGFTGSMAGAADYQIVASGPLAFVFSDTSVFDGTTVEIGTLPPLLDPRRLEGGSFRATFRFSQVTPNPGGNSFYELSASSGMTSYELLDAAGLVLHRGSGPSDPTAIVSNNYGGIPFSVDEVLLSSGVGGVTGLNVPAALYSSPPEFISVADFNVNGFVSAGVDYVTDLSIPTDAATYLAFPTPGRSFDVLLEFGDGDFIDQVGPYQHAATELRYDITSLAVNPAVPEPAGILAVLVAAMPCLTRRRR
jgi:hypothetical protein